MKARLKMILYFFLEFILSLTLLGSIGLIILQTTIYNPKYIKSQLEAAGYYDYLHSSINDEMSNYIIQANFDESIFEDIYTKEILEKEINTMIDCIYSNKEYHLNTEEVKENLENNISKYLEKYNMEVTDQPALDKFVTSMIDIYQDEITISNLTNKISKIVTKTKKLVNIGTIICLILTIILALITRFYCQDITLATPLFLTSLLLIFMYMLLNQNIIVNELFIWDDKVTSVIQEVLLNIFAKLKSYSIIAFIGGCLDVAIAHFLNPKKNNLK